MLLARPVLPVISEWEAQPVLEREWAAEWVAAADAVWVAAVAVEWVAVADVEWAVVAEWEWAVAFREQPAPGSPPLRTRAKWTISPH